MVYMRGLCAPPSCREEIDGYNHLKQGCGKNASAEIRRAKHHVIHEPAVSGDEWPHAGARASDSPAASAAAALPPPAGESSSAANRCRARTSTCQRASASRIRRAQVRAVCQRRSRCNSGSRRGAEEGGRGRSTMDPRSTGPSKGEGSDQPGLRNHRRLSTIGEDSVIFSPRDGQ